MEYLELERIAYISGNIAASEAFAKCAEFDEIDYSLDSGFSLDSSLQDQIDAEVDKQIAKQCPNYAEYKAFFDECFDRLNAHYPCPSVTNDYDQSIIFEAISKGDES